MLEKLDTYLLKIPEADSLSPAKLIDYFVYFLTVIEGCDYVQPSNVEACFDLSRLKKYSNISAYLSKNSMAKKGRSPKFIKTKHGYNLERRSKLEIQKSLHKGPARIETSHLLRGLLPKLTSTEEQAFLQEAIDCYEISARRAAIVLVWILAIHHLYSYIFDIELTAFNTALAKNTDKRIKITAIKKLDDFTEIPEGKFIELCRTATIISNDVRKILEEKLGVRNTSAHPSGVTVSDVKTTDFIIDLVDNVILKYKI
jgi:hypothetical protein